MIYKRWRTAVTKAWLGLCGLSHYFLVVEPLPQNSTTKMTLVVTDHGAGRTLGVFICGLSYFTFLTSKEGLLCEDVENVWHSHLPVGHETRGKSYITDFSSGSARTF